MNVGTEQTTYEKVKYLTALGLFGTALGIPVGLWAMNQWPDPADRLKVFVVLTASGLLIKETYHRLFQHGPAVHEPVPNQELLANYGRR